MALSFFLSNLIKKIWAQYFYKKYPNSLIVGTDISEKSLKYAQERYTNDQIKFTHLENLVLTDYFDLCYTNGVFHHIISRERRDVLREIYRFLKKDAWLSFFENNPFNVATRIVIKRIPLDKDTKMWSHIRAKKLILKTHFSRIIYFSYDLWKVHLHQRSRFPAG